MAAKKKSAARTWSGPEALEPLLVKVDELSEDPRNARLHNERNLESIRASLEKFGQMKPIVARDGVAVAGNGTLAAARALGWTHLAAVDASGLTEDEARAYAVADNRTGELAEWDYQVLAQTFRELKAADFDLDVTGFLDFEVAPLLAASWAPPTPAPKPEGPEGSDPSLTIHLDAEQAKTFGVACEAARHGLGTDPTQAELLVAICEGFLERDPPA